MEDELNRDRYTELAPWIAVLVFLSIAVPVMWTSALDSATRDHLSFVARTLAVDGAGVKTEAGSADPYREQEVIAQITAANAAYGSMVISKWALYASVIGGLVAIIGAFYVKRTFDQTNSALQHAETSAKAAWEAVAETQKANKIAERAIILEQRPWIVVELKKIKILGEVSRIEIIASFENIGRSPARMRKTHSAAWRMPTFPPNPEAYWCEGNAAFHIIPQGPTHALQTRSFLPVNSLDPDPSRFLQLRIGVQYSMLDSDEVYETVVAFDLYVTDDRIANGEERVSPVGFEINPNLAHGWMT